MYEQNMSPAERTATVQSKMVDSLSKAWVKGERKLVKSTIECAIGTETRRKWKDETAAALPEKDRDQFLTYMRS